MDERFGRIVLMDDDGTVVLPEYQVEPTLKQKVIAWSIIIGGGLAVGAFIGWAVWSILA